jgi:PAS domain S-box-containing protein
LRLEARLVPLRAVGALVIALALPLLGTTAMAGWAVVVPLASLLYNGLIAWALSRRPGWLAGGRTTLALDTVLVAAAAALLEPVTREGADVVVVTLVVAAGLRFGLRTSLLVAALYCLFEAALGLSRGQFGLGVFVVEAGFRVLAGALAALIRDEALAGEARFRRLAENAPDVIARYELGAAPGYRYVNPAVERVLGYTPEECYRDPSFGADLFAPEDLTALQAAGQTAGSVVAQTVRAHRKDGRSVWLEVRLLPVRDAAGALVAVEAVARDVTERVEAEAARAALLQQTRDAEERLRRALAAGGMGAWEIDLTTGRAVWDRTAEALHGFAPGVFDGTLGAVLARVHPEDRPSVEAAAAARPAGAAETEMEYRVLLPSGEVRWLVTKGAVECRPDGLPRRISGTLTDVTTRKEAEQQRATLAQTEKLRALGQMAGGVAHDLNQSLGMVAGYAELARLTLADQPPALDRAREMLETVQQAAVEGGETVRRLLVFARPALEGPTEPVALGQLLEGVVRLTAPRWRDAAQAEGRPIRAEVEASPDAVVDGQPAALGQALTNLVFNAVDALPRGGTIRLSARRLGARVEVTVADTGVGMPAAVRARLFEPFFTTKAERGTGLGLPQVHTIVQAHGGTAAVTSVEGAGTTVRLLFPAADAPAPAVAHGESPAASAGRLRVLVIDDEARLVDLAAAMLRGGGHAVETATSAEAALGLLSAAPFDAVVSDLSLGDGMNGWELAEAVRQRWPELRVVLATGWGAGIDPTAARARGVAAVVAKPYRARDLQRALAED